MDKKVNKGQNMEQAAVWLLKSLLCAYIISGILLLLLAFLLYKLNLDEGKVAAGIIMIYVVSTFAGGFIIGKLAGVRKFLWGLTCGILYFGLLLLVSIGIYRSLQGNGANVLTTFLLCAGGGMLGGMVS
ncbi:MAG: TIGR04086 family membrane protein [Ruminococcus sp.]|jgi:putative membrane protein (TIGR04086 family)|nr:TIGR04086 family membrane protein [Ruminococcus sp.]